jgi:hypothetical protein
VTRTIDRISSFVGPHCRGLFAVLLTPLALASASAQKPLGIELRPFVGAYLPTGEHANVLKPGTVVGFQAMVKASEYLSAVATAAWSLTEDKTASLDGAVEVLPYDLGAEAGMNRALANGMVLRPFVGLGIGGRSYGYRDREPHPQHSLSGYGAAGGQLQLGRLGLRIEARDYISGFKGLSGELAQRKTRNDVTIATGLAVAM